MTIPLRLALLLCLVLPLAAADVTIVADHANAVYTTGETVTWTITSAKDAPPAGLAWTVRSGGLTQVAAGTLSFTGRTATVTASLDQPGTLLLGVKVDDRTTVLAGAAVAWDRIPVSAPEPADFDAFWKAKLGELAAVPPAPVLEEIPSGEPTVQLWKITMANIAGSRIHGYLARPTGDAACPAMLQVQYAGVYALKKEWVVGPARNGWLALDISAHDIEVDGTPEYYAQLSAGPLKNYSTIGANDRKRSYFLRMYLSCYRAADYLAGRADWNQATLLVQGGSQGGLQTIVTAAIHPAVTIATANVPAGCDHTGPLVGRDGGWPKWLNGSEGAERDARIAACGYYDVVNFARRVHCPTLVGMGLIDTTCPPAGVFAMFNQLAGPKRIVIMPEFGHQGAHSAYYGTMGAWWNTAKAGKQPPM